MNDDLHDLMEKYEDMASRMEAYLSVDNLLISKNQPYSRETMVAPLSPKSKVLNIDLWKRRPIAYLPIMKQWEHESLKAYIIRFNNLGLTIDNHDKKITHVGSFGGTLA